MRKNYLALVALVFVIVIVLIVTINLGTPKKTTVTPSVMPEPTVVTEIAPQANTVMFLSPNPVDLTNSPQGSVDVVLDSNDNDVTGVQIELQYDPQAITNVSIVPGTFFKQSLELLKKVDSTKGKVIYLLGNSFSQPPVRGKGVVAKVSFQKVSGTSMKETPLTVLPTSLVSATGIDKSVLKNSVSTKVLLNK